MNTGIEEKEVNLNELTNEELLHNLDVEVDDKQLQNWAKTFKVKPKKIFNVNNISQIQKLIELSVRIKDVKLKPMGVWHSPSDLACTDDWIIKMTNVKGVVELKESSVIVYSGTTLHEINNYLDKHQKALSVLGSISDQTIAGCLATATHGSGINYKCISSFVKSMDVCVGLPNAPIVHCSKVLNEDLYYASLCSLGSTGIILTVEIEIEDAFNLEQKTIGLKFKEDLLRNEKVFLDKWYENTFTRAMWIPQINRVQWVTSNKTSKPISKLNESIFEKIFGLLFEPLLLLKRSIPFISPLLSYIYWIVNFGKETTITDKSYRIFNIDCGLMQYTTEWAIPLENGYECLLDLNDWLIREQDVDFPLEIRVADADNIWLSPAYSKNDEKFLWIGLIKYKPYNLNVKYRRMFHIFENILRNYGGKPHWAKHSTVTPEETKQNYENFDNFLTTINKYDPNQLFINPFVERHLIKPNTNKFVRHFKYNQVSSFGF